MLTPPNDHDKFTHTTAAVSLELHHKTWQSGKIIQIIFHNSNSRNLNLLNKKLGNIWLQLISKGFMYCKTFCTSLLFFCFKILKKGKDNSFSFIKKSHNSFKFHGCNFSCPFLALQMLWMLLGVDFFVMVSLIHLKKIYISLLLLTLYLVFFCSYRYQISQSIKQQKKPNRVDPKPLFLSWQKTSYLKRHFVAFCSFFPCSLTVFHRGRQQKSRGRQWKSSRADKQHCFP